MRWATAALFASLPMTVMLLGGMQTETAAAAVSVWLAVVILDNGDGDLRRLMAGALLFGLLCALKPVHAIAALPLLAWAIWRARQATSRIGTMTGSLLRGLIPAGPSERPAQIGRTAGRERR